MDLIKDAKKAFESLDLIKREDAYEVLTEYYHHKTEIQHKALREALDRVPSAQQEDRTSREFIELIVEYPPEDICTYPEYKGKPYYSIKYREDGEGFIGYGTYSPKVLSRYLHDYFIPSANQWIPCSERLPKEDAYYLVTLGYGSYEDGRDIEMIPLVDGDWDWSPIEQVIAWMPLPEPYKEGKNG